VFHNHHHPKVANLLVFHPLVALRANHRASLKAHLAKAQAVKAFQILRPVQAVNLPSLFLNLPHPRAVNRAAGQAQAGLAGV